jgi:hypothetical protein
MERLLQSFELSIYSDHGNSRRKLRMAGLRDYLHEVTLYSGSSDWGRPLEIWPGHNMVSHRLLECQFSLQIPGRHVFKWSIGSRQVCGHGGQATRPRS